MMRRAQRTHTLATLDRKRSTFAKLGATLALLVSVGLLLAAPAFAGYEQVANFAQSGESEQLQHTTGMAVNVSGAGGVPAGSVYAAAGNRVLRYSATGEFEEAWGWSVGKGSGEAKFERCGPQGEAAYPECSAQETGNGGGGEGKCPLLGQPGQEGVCEFSQLQGIDVDQTTGDVYALNSSRQHALIQLFNPEGSLIASFGDRVAEPPPPAPIESIEESPEKLHAAGHAIAVDPAGKVYVPDADLFQRIADPPGEARVMSFEPATAGDYAHYVYSGRADDIRVGSAVGGFTIGGLALDDEGHLYTATAAGTEIRELSPTSPSPPLCTYKVPDSALVGFAVNPATGEPFYSDYKDRKIHPLTACTAQGKFEALAPVALTPKPNISSNFVVYLAVDPALEWEAGRPAGILYAAEGGELEGGKHGVGYVLAPAVVRRPGVVSESVTGVGATSATLRARINPNGAQTRYAFQYLTAATYEANGPADRFAGAAETPLGGASLGAGQETLPAAVGISGLQPDAEYRYRVIASSCLEGEAGEVCEAVGTAEAFRTFPVETAGLPDGRAYELVSPAEKNGGEVFPLAPLLGSCAGWCKPGITLLAYPRQASPGGESVVYEGFPFSPTAGAPLENEYLSMRSAAGWRTTALSPAPQSSYGPVGYNTGLDDSILETRALESREAATLSGEAPAGYANLYLQSNTALGVPRPLLTAAPPNRSAATFAVRYIGASADFSRIFFEANDALTASTPFAPEAVDGGPGEFNLYEWAGGRLRLVNVGSGMRTAPGAEFGSGVQLKSGNPSHLSRVLANAISADGSRVFWSYSSGQVFVREDGETTAEIPDHTGRFLAASADDSRLLLSDGKLFDVDDLSAPPVDLTEGKGGFLGTLGQSEDLSHVYFVDTEALTGANAEGRSPDEGGPGEDNLYAWVEGRLDFVATLVPSDGGPYGDWAPSPVNRKAEASPSGRWLAFLSRAQLTGYENEGPCEYNSRFELLTVPCSEVFLYDSTSGRLICSSCDPSGAPPLGPSRVPSVEGATGTESQPSYLGDSGRLFFESGDSLSPFDTNGNVEDVYEYEPAGLGTCSRGGGCVSLISTGHGAVDSNFLAADPSGKNVFFTTRERLVGVDRDELMDVYDAREGGGFPEELAPAGCRGEACQAPVSPSAEPAPASAGISGPGNVAQKHPKKRPPHKKKHQKKKRPHHKKRHGKKSSQKKKHHKKGGAK
jgi:hypothetical protein